MSAPTVTTSNGVANTQWTLGPGLNVLRAAASGSTTTFTFSTLLMRPSSEGLSGGAVELELLSQETSGLSMQSGTGIQLVVVSPPTAGVSWSGSDPSGTTASINSTGLVAVVQGTNSPTPAREVTFTAAASSAGVGQIKVNSFNFGHFQRLTTLVWQPVPNAATYDVIVEFGNGCTPGAASCATWTQRDPHRHDLEPAVCAHL